MKKIRAVAIVPKDDNILLIHRKNEKEYYVFPGGGVEEGETVEQAVLRELKEETTMNAEIVKLLYHHSYNDDTEQFFYLCRHISGEPCLGEGPEQEKMKTGTQYYNPLWVPIDQIKKMLVYPLEIRDWLLEDIKDGFRDIPKTAHINISELKENL